MTKRDADAIEKWVGAAIWFAAGWIWHWAVS